MPVILLATILAADPGAAATITLVDGTEFHGRIESLDSEGVRAVDPSAPAAKLAEPIENLLLIDFGKRKGAAAAKPAIHVLCTNGTRLVGRSYRVTGRSAAVEGADGSRHELQVSAVAAVRMTPFDEPGGPQQEWFAKSLQSRTEDAIVVVRDGDRFDLDGIVGDVGDSTVTFFLDGAVRHDVKREIVESIFYARKPDDSKGMIADVHDQAGNRWVVDRMNWKPQSLEIRTAGGLQTALAQTSLERIDFSRGRIVFLSKIEPIVVRYTPFYNDTVWSYSRNSNDVGEPIRMGGVVYPSGIVAHSRTVMIYELAGQYRTFDFALGIEDSAGPLGDAVVRIAGDARTIGEYRVRAGAPAQAIELRVVDVRRLTLEVDFGESLDLGDWVVFGNARLTK